MKKLPKIAETVPGSYILSLLYGFFVGALPRQRDDFNFFTRSEVLRRKNERNKASWDNVKDKVRKACHSAIGGSASGGKPSAFCLLPSAFLRGFTMIELLLVVVIIGIAIGVTMPSLVASIQNQRLKTAARTMVTVARYARSMSVLKQTDLTLSFNLATGQIDLTSTNVSLPRFTRMIEGVNIVSVKTEGHDEKSEGFCAVNFKRNGLCQPFTVKIADHRGKNVVVKIDALAGVRTTEYGNEE